MLYFGYCTFLYKQELNRYMPEAVIVTKGYATNRRLEFRTAGDRRDRGYCHLSDGGDSWGVNALGIIVRHPDKYFDDQYDDFRKCFLTVRGDDGKTYDCWTFVLSRPGILMRPPDFYWQYIQDGMAELRFPQGYVDSVVNAYKTAEPCPGADRPSPLASTKKSSEPVDASSVEDR